MHFQVCSQTISSPKRHAAHVDIDADAHRFSLILGTGRSWILRDHFGVECLCCTWTHHSWHRNDEVLIHSCWLLLFHHALRFCGDCPLSSMMMSSPINWTYSQWIPDLSYVLFPVAFNGGGLWRDNKSNVEVQSKYDCQNICKTFLQQRNESSKTEYSLLS
jgi:hypothetical protein